MNNLIINRKGNKKADQINMDICDASGKPNYRTIQDWADVTQASGVISGGTITDNGDGTISVASGTAMVRSTNSATAPLMFCNFDASANISLTENVETYVYVDYNSGNPIIGTEITKLAEGRTKFYLGKCFREGNFAHVVNAGQNITEVVKRVQSWITQVNGEVVRASGVVLSEVGERYLATTDGVMFAGLTRLTTTGIDTSGADTFEYYYRSATPGEWIEVDSSQIDNGYWDDGTGTLNDLTSNRYGVHWVYGDPNGDLMVLYGQGDYTLTNAELSQPPSELPQHVQDFGFLVSKVIVQQGATNLYGIESAYNTAFTPSGAADHGELAGLADNDHPQYALIDGTNQPFTGNIGIGTVPQDALDVYGKIRLTSATGYATIQTVASGSIYFRPTDGLTYFNGAGMNNKFFAYDYSVDSNTYLTLEASGVSFRKSSVTNLKLKNSEDSYIDTTYKFGLGTATPSEKLDVVGNIKASGTIESPTIIELKRYAFMLSM